MTAWLLTWLWQGSALAAGVALALACAPRVNAATRHLIWCGVLVALASLGWASSPFRGLTPVPVRGSDPIYVPSAPDFLITTVISIWAVVALVSLLRLLPGLRAVYALRDCCEPFPCSIESRLPLWLEAKARGRRTRVMICDAAPGATVLGFERPCIAIPSSLVIGLTIDELDQVILHEHAHVQRRDDWSRLGQALLLSVLWMHPAALFVSRAISREREMACDEWVVARTGLPNTYASCLARAAELRRQRRGGSTLVPALVGGRHELVRRVDRLLAMRATPRRQPSLTAVIVAACAIVMTSVQLQGVPGLAEIAEIVLPQVLSSNIWTNAPRLETPGGLFLALAPIAPNASTFAPTAHIASVDKPNAPDAPNAPNASTFAPTAHIASVDKPNAPNAPNAPDAPDLVARVFPGAYDRPLASLASNAPGNVGWRALATPGVEIASTAKQTSLGIAGVFTRAGASLARSF